MTVPRRFAAFAAAVALVTVACDDPFAPEADLPVFADTISVFAMSGTPVSYPSVVQLFSVATGLLQAGAQFDIALDIDEDSNVVIYPAGLVSAGAPRVGLRDTALAFDDLDRAPRGEYQFEDPVVVQPGRIVIAEVSTQLCQFSLTPFFYSKIVVDSVQHDTRKIFLRVTTDPNCGFRSFEVGEVPRD